jgi:uncharacterized protein (DUF433 family)
MRDTGYPAADCPTLSRYRTSCRWRVFGSGGWQSCYDVNIVMSGKHPSREVLQQRIVRDVQICGGEPVFKGTRVTLRTVLASLAEGDTPEQIRAAFPSLQVEDVQAAIAFAAASAEEDLPVPAAPQIR